MIFILIILAATRASPLSLWTPPLVSLDQLQPPSCDVLDGCRSLGDITRSCVFTILLCTWISIHPNIPSPDEKWPRVALRRVGLVLLALTFPEAVIAWALRQRQVAVELAKKHKGEGWTLTHGFFATMGGFMEYEGNRPIRVLLPDQLESYSLMGNGDFPRISKAEIEDKSKGDAISKGLVILQTSWFLTQCVARGVQGLPITELELVTVTFAALNLVIYLLWWDKPQNVQRGIRVYKKRTTERMDDGHIEATVGFWDALRDALSDLRAAIIRGQLISRQLLWLTRILLWVLCKLYSAMAGDNEEYEKRVNTFYPGNWAKASEDFSIIFMAVVTLAFGGLHCVGWSFPFPSGAERALWRVASLSITSFPFTITLLGCAAEVSDIYRVPGFCGHIILVVAVFLYVHGRLVLLALPFSCLRSLPPAAFHVVRWTSFIPHV